MADNTEKSHEAEGEGETANPSIVETVQAKIESEAEEIRTKLENFKYYTSLFLGTLCIICIFAFLFLVPFVLDPAISTLMHEFVDVPVTCQANSVTIQYGKGNCTWSSCREGCTADMFVCFQVRVIYSKQKWVEGVKVKDVWDWVDLTRYDKAEKQVMKDTPLLVNIKGCGYPPDIDCKAFKKRYENFMEIGETFPCYYSKVNPWIVLESYDFTECIGNVIASIAIPNGIFVVSLIVLLYWYCPYCQARCKKYEEQTDNDDKDIGFDLEEEEPREY